MVKYVCAILFCLVWLFSRAQSPTDTIKNIVIEHLIEAPSAGLGKITITQDELIGWVLNKHIAVNQNETKISGWRIQIYNSSGKDARDKANEVRNKFMNANVNTKAYLIYQPPFFKIRVGDFRSKQDAFALYKSIISLYPVSYIVPDKVNFPNID